MGKLLYGVLQLFAGGLLGKLLIGAGLTLIVATGLNSGIELMLGHVLANVSSLPGKIFQLLMLAGLGQCISIIGGALLTRAALMAAGQIMGVKMGGSS